MPHKSRNDLIHLHEEPCATPRELLKSEDLRRVSNLFRRHGPEQNGHSDKTILDKLGENDSRLAMELYRFWRKKLHIVSSNTGEGREELDDLVRVTLLEICKRDPNPDKHWPVDETTSAFFSHFCRRLMNNGTIPAVHKDKQDTFGVPLYPDDVEGVGHESGKLSEEASITLQQLPPGIEYSNFLPPNDPELIQQKALLNQLGFSHVNLGSHSTFVSFTRKDENQDPKDGVWSDVATVPNGKFSSEPLQEVRQYGLGLFEGIGVERGEDGKVRIFRLKEHWQRMSRGGVKLGMPTQIPYEIFEKAVLDTVRANEKYIPPAGIGRLYIRPNWYDHGPKMHVGSSLQQVLFVTAVAIGSAQTYYQKTAAGPQSKEPDTGLTFFMPDNVSRAIDNGAGQTKGVGNYCPTIPHIKGAAREGMSGVIYLDPGHRRIEETNASSVLFLLKTGQGYTLITPKLEHRTILDSITRKTILELAQKELGWEVEERDISLEELRQLADKGQKGEDSGLVHAFSAGTAAVLTPIHNIQTGSFDPKSFDSNSGDIDVLKESTGEGESKKQKIKGDRIKIGKYDAQNPLGQAGQQLLNLLLEIKSGTFQQRTGKYQEWLTEVPMAA